MTNDPVTLDWSALKAVHDRFAEVAFGYCAGGCEVKPMLFAVRADARGEVLDMMPMPERLMADAFRDERGKDAFARLLYALVADTPHSRICNAALGWTPNVYVQINEAWWVVRTGARDVCTDLSKEPDRRECILINLHTRERSIPVKHEIVAEPMRHAVRGAFPTPLDIDSFSGRFSVQEANAQHGPQH